ncbi:hypothetical protein [Geobacter pickeringii]|uniref:hypothetical protein n=1 Tax=Geobacter pickeringii TaxID=345632 RepID=UPI0011857413|nr:hypothetical protein [Geobacter pickeringii]
MITAYKYFRVGEGIVFVFGDSPSGESDIQVRKDETFGNVLLIGEEHMVILDDEILDALAEISGVYYAESQPEEYKIEFTSYIPLDRLSLGKILAYCDR